MNMCFNKFFIRLFMFVILLFVQTIAFAQNYVAYESNGLWGLKDKNGKVILKPTYDAIDEFKEGYATVLKKVVGYEHWSPDNRTTGSSGPAASGAPIQMGVIDSTGKKIFGLAYCVIRPYSEGLAAIFYKGYWGFINKLGVLVIPYKYITVTDFKNGLSAANNSNRLQLINKSGTAITTPKYKSIGEFINGLARVEVGMAEGGKLGLGQTGFINKYGTEVIKPKYYDAGPFIDGLSRVRDTGGYGYINTKGKVIISPKFYEATHFNQGNAAVRMSSTPYWKFITKTGKSITGYIYRFDISTEGVCPFKDGRAVVKNKYGVTGMIDTGGRVIVAFAHASIDAFKSGLALVDGVQHPLSKVPISFVNKFGKFIIPASLEILEAQDFSEGLAAVKIGSLWGYYDSTGKQVVAPKYTLVMPFSYGLAAVQKSGNLWGFIDKTGKEVIIPKYKFVTYFKDGMFKVAIRNLQSTNNYLFGLVDKTGTEILAPKYNDIQDFSEGLAPVMVEEYYNYTVRKYGFIDKTGKLIIPVSYDSVEPFYKGRAIVSLMSRTFYIDKIDQ